MSFVDVVLSKQFVIGTVLNNLVFQLWLLLSVSDTFGGISGTVQKHCAVHYGNTGCLVFK